MWKTLFGKLRTNEDNVAVKAGLAVGITALAFAGGIWAVKSGKATPVILVLEDAADVVTDATKA